MAKRLKDAARPTQPPKADMSQLVTRVDELSRKVLNKPLASGAMVGLPRWKRWLGGEDEYDITGLRDVVNTNATFTNQIKGDVDTHGQAILEMRAEIAALKEAPPARPFP